MLPKLETTTNHSQTNHLLSDQKQAALHRLTIPEYRRQLENWRYAEEQLRQEADECAVSTKPVRRPAYPSPADVVVDFDYGALPDSFSTPVCNDNTLPPAERLHSRGKIGDNRGESRYDRD